ncbi:hypothetical protein [uncultured Chitinophaga sp.]|uniref:hypothetical protein n=1 Tax=uncultured Chitinophaga sp. TaxID=339340 RepID=UPI0025CC1F26|nr:hypothetical protein [uncultured Chitinophaga sp.]
MEKFIKTPVQVAQQLEHWYRMYHPEGKDTDTFILFGQLPSAVKETLLPLMALPALELPVLALMLHETCFVINTTERFIRVDGEQMESVYYQEFLFHKGYKTMTTMEESGPNVKAEGKTGEFEILKTNGESVFWIIPTGRAGFKFWNVTKRCQIIGRKYHIQQEQ